jgi:hypothetical protein
MKKGKFLVLGLIALLLAGGLALVSCGLNCPDSGNCKWTYDPVTQTADGSLKECSDKCITNQIVDSSTSTSKKKWNCDC